MTLTPKASRVAKNVTIVFIGPLGWDTQFVFFESFCNLVRWISGKHEDLFFKRPEVNCFIIKVQYKVQD